MLNFAVQGPRNITHDLAVDRARCADVALARNQRAGIERILDCPALRLSDVDVALIFRQHAAALGMQVQRGAAIFLNDEAREVGVAVRVAAAGRNAGTHLSGGRIESLAKDNVHDLLVGSISIFESDFFGKDLDTLDRFCRNVAHFPEARDALPIEKYDWPPVRAALGTPDLRRERIKKIIDVGRAGCPDVSRGEHILGRDIADDRATRTRASDNDLVLASLILIERLSIHRVRLRSGGIGRLRLRC